MSSDNIEVSRLQRIDSICDRFEAAWRGAAQGDKVRPTIEAFLSNDGKSPQLELLCALIRIDIHWRRKNSEQPTPNDYRKRFPDHETAIAALFENLMPAAKSTADTSDHSIQPGTNIGSYKILSVLGEGGFGVVYLAERERPVKRRVALKVIKPGMDSKQVLARFEAERQALAVMDHTHVAKVFDAGMTESGRSYFVMEYVKGIPVTEHCDRKKLGIAERLKLVIQVCEAVQHAHQKGIVHRDLKPRNILVSLEGNRSVCKVIDFGVAKAMAGPLTEKTIYTEQGQIIGTPEYMSPEQAEMTNQDIDTRTDIYSLGVVLYELLTGSLPFTADYLRKGGFDHIRQVIREEDPPTPSTRITSLAAPQASQITRSRHIELRELKRELQGDLDWITLKAMEKDRQRRYETANALSIDIQRYLNNEPILARPPSTLYRLSKMARRNKAAFLATTAVAAALVIGLAAAMWGLTAANFHRGVAEDRLTRAETAEREARQERDDAREARGIAIRESAAAGEARQQAATRAKELARRIYLIHLANADRALLEKNYARARTELDACPQEHRGWEWHYLVGRIRATIVHAFPGAEQPIFSRDGKRLIAIGALGAPEQRLAQIWDLTSDALVGTLKHESRLSYIAMSPDEKRIAGGDYNGNLFVWDAATGKKLWTVGKHTARFDGLAFSPDGSLIASANVDKTLKIFDATSGQVRFTFEFVEDYFRKVMFSPDGRWISSAGANGRESAMIIDVTTGETAATFPGEGHMIPTFDPSGRRIATSNLDGSITLWDWDGDQLTVHRSWQASDLHVWALDFSAVGHRLVSGDRGKGVKVWDVATGQELAALDSGTGALWLAADPRGGQVAFFTILDGVRLWQYGGHAEGLTVKPVDGAAVASFSPDGQLIAASHARASLWVGNARRDTTNQGQKISVLDAASGTDILKIGENLHSASWTPDGRHIVAAADPQREIRIHSTSTGELTRAFTGDTSAFAGFAVSRRQLDVVSIDGTIRMWDLQSGEEAGVFSSGLENRGELICMGISPSNARVGVAYFPEYTVEIWDARNQTLVRTLAVPSQIVGRIAFSQDGNDLYVGAVGGRLTAFDIDSGRETKRFTGHVSSVGAIALAPGEDQIVSGDTSGRVIVWDVTRGQPLVTLTDGGQSVRSLDWNSDGSRIVAGKGDGTVQIWTLPRSR